MADSKKEDGLYPAHFKKKHIANHLKPQKFNSTSTLYIDSTISKPKQSELMKCISEYFLKCMKDGTNITDAWREKYQIFDESQHPLTSTHVDTTSLPDIEKLEKHIKSVFKIGQLAHESLIMAVAYLDRIRENTDFDLQPFNWKRMILSLLILASKVWEDQAVWNVDFLDLFPLTTPHDLGQLEKKVLGLLSFDVSLRASEYAKIYFNLKAESASTVEQFLELKPLDKEGETALELRTKNYTAKYNAPPDTKLFRSTGSVDDLSNNIRSPKVILN